MRWRWLWPLVAALALDGFARVDRAWAGDPMLISGTISWVSESAIEINGFRGMIDESTDIRGEGGAASVASLRRGMPAEMELDDSGHALQIRATGVVE